jgi:hypothetical protein
MSSESSMPTLLRGVPMRAVIRDRPENDKLVSSDSNDSRSVSNDSRSCEQSESRESSSL